MFEVRLGVQRAENHENAGPLLPSERVEEDETTDQDADELSRRHDDGEEQRAEFFDGVKNAQLTERGTQGEDEDVGEHGGVAGDEFEGLENGAVGDDPGEGERGGDAVDVEHLIVRLHLVPSEEFILERARETVET